MSSWDSGLVPCWYSGFYRDESEGCTLVNNTATGNYYGFAFERADGNMVSDNTAAGNTDGFYLYLSDKNTLTGNTAASNSGHGVRALQSFNNRMYLNRFEYNGQYNAWSGWSSNLWDDRVSLGDYWRDHSGTGTYPIPGLDEELDHYPLIMQGTTTTATVSTTTGTTTATTTLTDYSSLVLTIGLVAVVVQVSVLVIMLRLEGHSEELRSGLLPIW